MSEQTFNKIKELLVRTGKTSGELAKYMGVKEQTVSSWCTNTNQPEVPTLFRISNFLEMEAGELLTSKKDLRAVEKKKKIIRPKPSKKNKRRK